VIAVRRLPSLTGPYREQHAAIVITPGRLAFVVTGSTDPIAIIDA
jgi:hypothetical protein